MGSIPQAFMFNEEANEGLFMVRTEGEVQNNRPMTEQNQHARHKNASTAYQAQSQPDQSPERFQQ